LNKCAALRFVVRLSIGAGSTNLYGTLLNRAHPTPPIGIRKSTGNLRLRRRFCFWITFLGRIIRDTGDARRAFLQSFIHQQQRSYQALFSAACILSFQEFAASWAASLKRLSGTLTLGGS
jgi:hypothetical protein